MTALSTRILGFACVIAITVTGVTLARAELYRYVDENGRAHYTNDPRSVPPRYRKRTREMSEK